jgi:type VI protein secretion system component VasK
MNSRIESNIARIEVLSMNTEIIVAILAFVGTLAGSYFSNNKTTAVIQEQIKNIKEDISILSNRVDKHNNLISRMSVVEEKIKELENKGER